MSMKQASLTHKDQRKTSHFYFFIFFHLLSQDLTFLNQVKAHTLRLAAMEE